MKFHFWDNYQNMLDVIIWKKQIISPIWNTHGVPLKLINYTLSASTVWALMSRVNGEIEVDTIEVVYSQRSTHLQQKTMNKLVQAYFKAYQDYLTNDEQQ